MRAGVDFQIANGHDSTLPQLSVGGHESLHHTHNNHNTAQQQSAGVSKSSVARRGIKRARLNSYPAHDLQAQPVLSTDTFAQPILPSQTQQASPALQSAYIPSAGSHPAAYDHTQLGYYQSPSLGYPPQLTAITSFYGGVPGHSSASSADHEPEPQSAVSYASSQENTYQTNAEQHTYLSPTHRADASARPPPSMAERQFYSSYEGYAPGQAQVPNMNGVMSYSGNWQEVPWLQGQWAAQQPRQPDDAGGQEYPDQSTSSYAQSGISAPSTPFQDTAELYGNDTSLHLRLQSLNVLDSLEATQIILSLAKPSLEDIEKLAFGEDDEEKQAYLTRKNLFDQTRKVYTRESPFIDPMTTQLFDLGQQEIILKANRATFISTLLHAHDVNIMDLNRYFLEVFVPIGTRLLKWQGAIFLDLKTQLYISALTNSYGQVGALLDELFPADIDEILAARHPDTSHLVPSEHDFVERVRARKQYLMAEPEETAVDVLPQKYAWRDFLIDFSAYVNKNVEFLLSSATRPTASQLRTEGFPESMRQQCQYQLQQDEGAEPACNPAMYTSFGKLIPPDTTVPLLRPQDSSTSAEAPTASTERSPSSTAPPLRKSNSDGNTATTSSKTSSSYRHPWRPEEEKALLTGLEEAKGPYWSRILSMYGRGGSRSEVLKDRNQIQLKDKARNLKLWYLKTGNEVPACLLGVTGNLRKRGGAKFRGVEGGEGEGGQGGEGKE